MNAREKARTRLAWMLYCREQGEGATDRDAPPDWQPDRTLLAQVDDVLAAIESDL